MGPDYYRSVKSNHKITSSTKEKGASFLKLAPYIYFKGLITIPDNNFG